MIEIHATRGNTTPEKQKSAALNWVQSPDNVGGRDNGNPEWGSSFSHAIGTDGSEGTVLDDDQMPTYSAGYGGVGSTYAIDEYAISYELAQSPAQEPFSDAIYARLAKEVAVDCKRYGIPPVMLSITSQKGTVPTGIVRHDRCENGIKLGKTDPGAQFNEARFITMLKAEMQDAETEDDMTLEFFKRSDGTVFAIGAYGKRPISKEEWKVYRQAGYTAKEVDNLGEIPNFRQPSGGGLTPEEAVEAHKQAAREGTG